jgi:hypothetical protein
MGAIDEELKRQLAGGCDEASCIAEIGEALGARFMITGKFSRFGSRYILLLKLVDIEKVKAVNTTSLQAKKIEAVLDLLEAKIVELLRARAAPVDAQQPRAVRPGTRKSKRGPPPPYLRHKFPGELNNAPVEIKRKRARAVKPANLDKAASNRANDPLGYFVLGGGILTLGLTAVKYGQYTALREETGSQVSAGGLYGLGAMLGVAFSGLGAYYLLD